MTVLPPGALPPVTAEVAAAALDLLPARLRKRVDGAVAKAAGWPVERVADGVLVRAGDDTVVTLTTAPDGRVASADAAVCGCLLAPACLHRAVVLSMAPVAEEGFDSPGTEGPDDAGDAEVPEAPEVAKAPGTAEDATDRTVRTDDSSDPDPDSDNTDDTRDTAQASPAAELTDAQAGALRALGDAGVGVLVAGVAGAGAVVRAEVLHAAHSARLAGLHRPAAVAVRVARRLGEARSEDPAFRLSELSADLAELLDAVQRPDTAQGPARREYRPAQPLRLYGLFTEPVVTASGYAGATVYAMAPDGSLRTVSDVAPGGPERALQAAVTALVPGGSALPLRELGDGGGVILTSPTVSADGRIGGGGRVRSVRAAGGGWHEPPLDALWRRPPSAQLDAALDWWARPAGERTAGGDLLFLTGTVTATGFAVEGGPVVSLYAPDERPELPYAENLRLLAARPGLRLRLIARVAPDRPGGVRALAAAWEGHEGEPLRADLGLRRLNRTHVPAAPSAAPPRTSVSAPAPVPALPLELDLLGRAVDRTVAGGRSLAAAAADGELPRRLRAVGLTTGARCARELQDAAAARSRDALGRLLPADPGAFARAWLAAAVYASAATRSLLSAAWSPPEPEPDPASARASDGAPDRASAPASNPPPEPTPEVPPEPTPEVPSEPTPKPPPEPASGPSSQAGRARRGPTDVRP
ncbi:hypothetical protein [Streptomyces sp. NPDC006368]|uniref:hypothetical protein n=1 Tax=Streptomyces sp. NPDC006368 TaxID=3156760 RepID=UPI0033A081F4